MKHFLRFLGAYKLFFIAVAGLAAAGILTLLQQTLEAELVLGAISAFEVLPILLGIWRDIRGGTYGVDVLAVTAIVTSVILHQYWAAIVIVIMFTGGRSLEDFAARRARSELRALLKRRPQHAHLLRKKGVVQDVPASAIAERDMIVIRPGEVVPVDALITDGIGTFDESSLTGEHAPQVKDVGMQLLSGSVNMDGLITAKALHSAHESQYQQIVRLVRSAGENPAPFVRLADRYSVPFTVAAYAIAIGAWVLGHQPIRFLEVIVVATPCPLILATPIALIAGMSRAARDGIIIKTGAALEQLAQIKTFAFDKTGTLTQGQPAVEQVTAFEPFTRELVLRYAASLEQNSNHALAQATILAAKGESAPLQKAKHVKEVAGMGLEARIGNREIIVGRSNLMREQAVVIPKGFRYAQMAQTATYVAVDGKLAGYLTFRDSLRHEAKTTLASLRRLGVVRLLMITGDNAAAARAVAKSIGVTDIKADALPADKLHAIEAVSDRPLAFVGDGVNDAPVLTAADVGIALGARGSTVASEAADVVILQDNLTYVLRAVVISRRSFRIAQQSIVGGIALSLILMFVFATGRFSPITGAAVQEAVDVLVILNALRAHTSKSRD